MSLIKPKGLSKVGVSSSLKGFDLLRDSFNQMISKISQHKQTYEEKNQKLKDIDLQKTNLHQRNYWKAYFLAYFIQNIQ